MSSTTRARGASTTEGKKGERTESERGREEVVDVEVERKKKAKPMARLFFPRSIPERSAPAALLELHSYSLSEVVDGESTLECASPGQQRGQENARARRRAGERASRETN